jgi:CheY-like chemotaxis protein
MEGFRVATASDGVEALQVIAREPPDVALIDVMMPLMNGVALSEALLASEHHRHVPIVLMSAALGVVPPSLIEKVTVLRKPFHIDGLVECLRAAIAAAQRPSARER